MSEKSAKNTGSTPVTEAGEIDSLLHGPGEGTPIDQIINDQKYQMRKDLDDNRVKAYCDIYKKYPNRLPAIIVVRIRGKLYLVSGFHQLAAAKQAGLESINVIIIDGDEKQAFWIALGSNNQGKTLNAGDKARAIEIALEQFPNYSNVLIAEQVGCSESYVRKIKDKPQVRTSANLGGTVVGKDGKKHPSRKPKNTSSDQSQPKTECADPLQASKPDVVPSAKSDSVAPTVSQKVRVDLAKKNPALDELLKIDDPYKAGQAVARLIRMYCREIDPESKEAFEHPIRSALR